MTSVPLVARVALWCCAFCAALFARRCLSSPLREVSEHELYLHSTLVVALFGPFHGWCLHEYDISLSSVIASPPCAFLMANPYRGSICASRMPILMSSIARSTGRRAGTRRALLSSPLSRLRVARTRKARTSLCSNLDLNILN